MLFSPHLQKTVPLAASLVCAVLAGVMWMPLGQSPRASDLPPETVTSDTGPDPKAVIAEGARQLLARPLFHITRRQPQVATAAEPVQVVVTLSLMGIVENDNVQVALMHLSDRSRLFRVSVGDKIGNWEIEEITPISVTVITPDGKREMITLKQNN